MGYGDPKALTGSRREAAGARCDQIAAAYDDLGRLVGSRRENVAIVANATAGFIQAMTSFDFVAGAGIRRWVRES